MCHYPVLMDERFAIYYCSTCKSDVVFDRCNLSEGMAWETPCFCSVEYNIHTTSQCLKAHQTQSLCNSSASIYSCISNHIHSNYYMAYSSNIPTATGSYIVNLRIHKYNRYRAITVIWDNRGNSPWVFNTIDNSLRRNFAWVYYTTARLALSHMMKLTSPVQLHLFVGLVALGLCSLIV